MDSMSDLYQQDAPEVVEYDVSQQVRIGDPDDVADAVRRLFVMLFPVADYAPIAQSFRDVAAMYRGENPEFHPCDTSYHNLRHILDVALTVTRLVIGYEQDHQNSAESLGLERVQLGIIAAIFHDIGYLRRIDDMETVHGAEYTMTHVTRGTCFLANYLPRLGFSHCVERMNELLHYTGYERDVHMPDSLDHTLGCLLGTGDLIAQMADRAYLERCRDGLYQEFKIGKVPAPGRGDGLPFESPDELLTQTPDFMRATIAERLDKRFGGVYHYAARFFDGINLYMEGVEKNCMFLEQILRNRSFDDLKRRVI